MLGIIMGIVIGIVAPSGSVSQENLEKVLHFLKQKGFSVKIPNDLLKSDLFFANTDAQRLAHLKTAFNDPDIDIIWPVRGGAGLNRLMPAIKKWPIPKKRKLFAGFSDATALHIFLNQSWGWPTLHSPFMAPYFYDRIDLPSIDQTLTYFKDSSTFLASSRVIVFPRSLRPMNKAAAKLKSITGDVIGGNLSLVQCSAGTGWQIKPKGKIIYLEEIEEAAYRIDRTLIHLKDAGCFKGAKAIILGDFLRLKISDNLIPIVLKRFAESLDIPVFALPGTGHGMQNTPLPLGKKTKFRIQAASGT